MKKIAFSDKYGLTQAVLEGRKTTTRRIIKGDYENIGVFFADGHHIVGYNGNIMGSSAIELHPLYQVGEIVAVAQSYEKIYLSFNDCYRHEFSLRVSFVHHNNDLTNIPGWNNKMFVKANLMPYRIRITDFKAERLQDISEANIFNEGIRMRFAEGQTKPYFTFPTYDKNNPRDIFLSPREAFAALIDRISGRGTWERNPWVFGYEFELIQ